MALHSASASATDVDSENQGDNSQVRNKSHFSQLRLVKKYINQIFEFTVQN